MKTKIAFSMIAGLALIHALCAQSPTPQPSLDTSKMSPEQKQIQMAMEIDKVRSELRHAIAKANRLLKDGVAGAKADEVKKNIPPDEVKRMDAAVKSYASPSPASH
jgi:hypothetical protein